MIRCTWTEMNCQHSAFSISTQLSTAIGKLNSIIADNSSSAKATGHQTIIPQHMPSVVWFEYVLQCYIWRINTLSIVSWLLVVFSLTVSMLAVTFHCDFGTFSFVLWFWNTAQTQIMEHEKELINAAKLWTGGLDGISIGSSKNNWMIK